MMTEHRGHLWGLLVALLCPAEATHSATTRPAVDITGNRQLFLGDDVLLAEQSNNTRVTVNRAADPVTWQTVLESDQRWERGCCSSSIEGLTKFGG